MATKLFGPVRFVTVATPRYLDRMGRPRHPKDLLGHNCIPRRLDPVLYDQWKFAHKGKEFRVQVKGTLIMNDFLLMLQAAADGAGVAYTMEDAVRNQVATGALEIVLKPFACSSEGLYVYYPRRNQVLPKLRAFIDCIKG